MYFFDGTCMLLGIRVGVTQNDYCLEFCIFCIEAKVLAIFHV